MIHEQVHCWDEAANHQLPIAVAFWIIPIASVGECSSLMQTLMQIHCSTRSVILNVTATSTHAHMYTHATHVYCPHWLLIQWSCPCSCMHIPVHSPWLPGYIDVMQTILIILIMAGLFPDRPCCTHEVLVVIWEKDQYKGRNWKSEGWGGGKFTRYHDILELATTSGISLNTFQLPFYIQLDVWLAIILPLQSKVRDLIVGLWELHLWMEDVLVPAFLGTVSWSWYWIYVIIIPMILNLEKVHPGEGNKDYVVHLLRLRIMRSLLTSETIKTVYRHMSQRAK